MNSDISKQKILLVIDSLHCGGAQRQLCYLAHGLQLLGYKVTVFVYHTEFDFFEPYLNERGIDIIHASRKSKTQTIGHIYKAINEHGFSWVISYLDGPNIYSLGAKVYASLKGVQIKVCVSDRSSTADGKLYGKEKWRRQLYRIADAVVANSNYQADTLQRSFPTIANRVHAILNCVDDRFFQSRIVPETLAHADQKVYAVVGQINHGKNLHGLVQAMIQCKEKLPMMPVIKWAGRVGEGSEAYFEEQKALIMDSGLSNSLIFLGSVDDVPKMLNEVHGLIHPSLREGLPNVVCEAMTIGLPVAIGDISDAKILTGNERGFLFDPNSSEELSDAIVKLTKLSSDEAAHMSRAAARFAEENFRIQTMAQKYIDVLESASLPV